MKIILKTIFLLKYNENNFENLIFEKYISGCIALHKRYIINLKFVIEKFIYLSGR